MMEIDKFAVEKRCVGLRTLALVGGHSPILFMLVLLPGYAIYAGDIRVPDLLLSDLYAAEKGTLPYQSLFLIGYCLFADMSLWCFSQYALYVCSEEPRAKAACGVIFVFCIFGINFCLYLLLGFTFEEEWLTDGSKNESVTSLFMQQPLYQMVSWIIHISAATILFASIGMCALLAVNVLEPLARESGGKMNEPAEDTRRRWFWTRSCMWSLPVVGVVRLAHIFHDRHMWAYPLLIMEIWILFSAGCVMLFGFLHTMMMLDFQEPLIDREMCRLLLGWSSLNKNELKRRGRSSSGRRKTKGE
ncbi:unnamed protein product [Amoebophrya sp. A25]|nr:unnamed protein product [Amoebophrya sp. A25]|eukprot:GSA25T00012710001.1